MRRRPIALAAAALALTVVAAVRTSATAVPARMLKRALRMNIDLHAFAGGTRVNAAVASRRRSRCRARHTSPMPPRPSNWSSR